MMQRESRQGRGIMSGLSGRLPRAQVGQLAMVGNLIPPRGSLTDAPDLELDPVKSKQSIHQRPPSPSLQQLQSLVLIHH
jgi:hypothetical protein